MIEQIGVEVATCNPHTWLGLPTGQLGKESRLGAPLSDGCVNASHTRDAAIYEAQSDRANLVRVREKGSRVTLMDEHHLTETAGPGRAEEGSPA